MSEINKTNEETLEQSKVLGSEELNYVVGGTDCWYRCVECGNRAKMNSDYENSIFNPLKCPECGGHVVRE